MHYEHHIVENYFNIFVMINKLLIITNSEFVTKYYSPRKIYYYLFQAKAIQIITSTSKIRKKIYSFKINSLHINDMVTLYTCHPRSTSIYSLHVISKRKIKIIEWCIIILSNIYYFLKFTHLVKKFKKLLFIF